MSDSKKKSRQFGNIRKLRSGRYQARYRGPDGNLRPAPATFERKADASRWLSLKEAEISKGEWIAPESGRQSFREYAEQWMRDRVLKPRSAVLYNGLLANHLYPTFGDLSLIDVDEATIRRWRKARLEAGPKAKRPFGPVTVAKAYRLLHAIFETAAEDDRIKETLSQPDKGALRTDTPKSQAGKRIVSFPAEIAPEIRWHLERFAEPGERGFVFVGPKGGQLRRSNFHKSVWIKAREKVDLPGLHFHDLRHTGGTLTAATGATLKELMARLGHSSVRAALIYQHATRDRDQAIAQALGTFVRDVRNAAEKQPDTGEREEREA
jgi:integrase